MPSSVSASGSRLQTLNTKQIDAPFNQSAVVAGLVEPFKPPKPSAPSKNPTVAQTGVNGAGSATKKANEVAAAKAAAGELSRKAKLDPATTRTPCDVAREEQV